MAKTVEIIDRTAEVLAEFEEKKIKMMLQLGLAGERNAKLEITKLVYDTPQSDSYKRTGNLRNSLTYFPKNPSANDNEVIVGTNVEYGKFVEFGTSRGMKPRPYLKQSVTNHMDEYKSICEKSMK